MEYKNLDFFMAITLLNIQFVVESEMSKIRHD